MREGYCTKKIFTGARWDIGGHPCPRKAQTGTLFCFQHQPEAEAKRAKEWEERYQAEKKADAERYRIRAERERKADAYDFLLAAAREAERALEAMYRVIVRGHCPTDVTIVCDSIKSDALARLREYTK